MPAGLLALLALGCASPTKRNNANASQDRLVPRKVEAAIRRSTQTLVHVQTARSEIVATPDHPFAVLSRGWVKAGDLKTGDLLVSGEREVIEVSSLRIEQLDAPVQVFNLTIAQSHTYLVGPQRLLVHNASCGSTSASVERKEQRPEENHASTSRGIVTRGEEELRTKIAEQASRVRDKVRQELAHYEELSRTLAEAYRDGRIKPDDAEWARYDKLNEDIDNLQLAIFDRRRDGDTAALHQSLDLLNGMNQVKRSGHEVLNDRAEAVLPLIREIDTLNYVVQDRLDHLAKGYQAELDDAARFKNSHESGTGTPESIRADYQHTVKDLRKEVEHARAETKVENAMLTLLGAALLAEVQAKEEGMGKKVLNFFSSKKGAEHRQEKSAEKRREELERKLGDLYDVAMEDGHVNLGIKSEAVGSMTLPELANRLDMILADGKPRYVDRAGRAAVDRSRDFWLTKEKIGGKKRTGVDVLPGTYERLGTTRDESGRLTPRERLIEAGMAAINSTEVNKLKFALTADAREAIDAEYNKSNSWLNPTPGLTREKVDILTRTIDVIVLCKNADEMLQMIKEAQRQHAELLREWHGAKGGETAKTLDRWAAAARKAQRSARASQSTPVAI